MTMLWLDDRRPAPAGWIRVRSVNEAIAYLTDHQVTHASLDHDLGIYEPDGGDGAYLTDWLAEQSALHGVDRWPTEGIRVHSSNPDGLRTMLATTNRYGPYGWPLGATFGTAPAGGWPSADTYID